ncbi:MAG: hypothetical protein DHS20C14_10610 [Phycisphaeraceae bacterium]|nr:MAG: hypothetical protein DHS20C14_10610 [Phycisphaeraceae bacterium]
MHTLDSTYRQTAGQTGPGRIAALTLTLSMLAGTTQALAQNTGLGGYSDEPNPAEVDNDVTTSEDEARPIGDLNFDVSVTEYDLVDLHVNNEDLGRVLQLLSIQSQRNILASNSVEASVTADLYGVTFYDALDAILHVNGFGYIERGNFIYVYTREEMTQIEEAARTRESRVFHLNHLNAADAGAFAANMISEGGSIVTNAATEVFGLSGDNPIGADSFAAEATLVVWDYPENIDAIGALLTQIDTRPVQVLVEATILQTTLNEANAFGVDFAIINDMDFLDFVGTGGPLSVVNGLISGEGETVAGTAVDAGGLDGRGSAIGSSVANIDGPATLKAGIVNEDVAVFLRVLDQVTDVTVVSNPKILTLNRQPARVLVGTKVGYLNTTTTETATTQTVEFLDTGTQLSVRPFVSDTGDIRLELKPQVSSAQLREVADNSGNTVTIPDEDTTELTTNVLLRDGQTAVLGGLFTELTTTTRRQVPLLGDIPLIGSAFRGNDDSTRRNEIIFMVTPSVVNDAILDSHGELANSYVQNTRMGARNGTLPFSRDRRVSRLLIEARRHADEGEVDMAVFKVQKAIGLAPMSPDARVLLEELTNLKSRRPSRSLMEGIFHRELLEPMPGVRSDEGYFRNPFIKRPDGTSASASEVAQAAPVQARTATSEVTLTDGSRVQVADIVVDDTETMVFTTQEPMNTDAEATETEAWIEFDDSDNAGFESEVAEVETEDLSSADDSIEDFEFDWVSPEFEEPAVVVNDESGYEWVEPAEETVAEAPVAAAAPTSSNGVITIESLPAQGEWAWPSQGTESVEIDIAENDEFDWANDAESMSEGVQVADADSWEFGGPEAFEFEDESFVEPTNEMITMEDIEITDEQAGGHNAQAWTSEPAEFDPLAMSDEQLDAEYTLEPLESISMGNNSPANERFDAPASEILNMITSEPTGKAAPAVKSTRMPAPAMAEGTTPASAAARGGFLVVPLPTGGVVQIPWPMHQTVDSDGVRWREFTSVPVDSVEDAGFDALDR